MCLARGVYNYHYNSVITRLADRALAACTYLCKVLCGWVRAIYIYMFKSLTLGRQHNALVMRYVLYIYIYIYWPRPSYIYHKLYKGHSIYIIYRARYYKYMYIKPERNQLDHRVDAITPTGECDADDWTHSSDQKLPGLRLRWLCHWHILAKFERDAIIRRGFTDGLATTSLVVRWRKRWFLWLCTQSTNICQWH